MKKAKKAAIPVTPPRPGMRISDWAVARSNQKAIKALPTPFILPSPPPGVLPRGYRGPTMAKDQDIGGLYSWANQAVYNGAFYEGQTWLGFTYLSELAQRPEYRRLSEVLATEATRKWIEFGSKSSKDGKVDKKSKKKQIARIAELETEFKRLKVQDAFRVMSEKDGFFGRMHLYVDLGTTEDRDELQTPIGDATKDNRWSKMKIRKGSLQALRPIEPLWCYPANYNANDPLRGDWYQPQSWFCQGKQIHASRLLTFIAREVPDMLKPAYMFGGLSLSQMAKPYVDNWLRNRQSVSDIIGNFSTSGIMTDLSTSLAGDGDQLFRRLALFNNFRNNQGALVLNKDSEEFFQFNVPLSTLDQLQAQSQEHMCSISGTPVIKLLGITPHGLNASTEGELESWYDWVEAYQERMFTEKLERVMRIAMMSLWGEVDEDIVFTYVSLRSDDPIASANERKLLAETDDILIAAEIIAPKEARQRLADDEESGYNGIDVDDVPEPIDEGAENIDIRGTQRPPQFVSKEAA